VNTLTWVQPPDLLAHELVASADEGKDVSDIRARWRAAGGQPEAPRGGRGVPADGPLRDLAEQLLDELDSRPAPPTLREREPADWAALTATLPAGVTSTAPDPETLPDRLLGAWLGRAAGCLLGKPVEKIPRDGIREILHSQGRWPLRSWFTELGLPEEVRRRWPWNRRSAGTSLAENIDGMPEDDDLNFCLVALRVLESHGPDFTADDVAAVWLSELPAGRVFTAERVAYRNLLLGESPPRTAHRRNPFREWIGAQIRTDLYGWVSPGDPAAAASMAWRDASVSHLGNGIYGGMFAAALAARALVAGDVGDVLDAGLSVIPPTSRYADAIRFGIALGHSTGDREACLDQLYDRYGHLHWVHVLNNAALVAFALTRSRGDFAEAICTVVTGGWDTDSNGATVGSVCGALHGARGLPEQWTTPLKNRLSSSMPGFDGIGFDELADRTLALVPR
jgi:ADP-ribosylglycohydrolase